MHIYAEHENEMPVCLRTLYNYIDEGELTIKNVDFRRKTGYKPRNKKITILMDFAQWSSDNVEHMRILNM